MNVICKIKSGMYPVHILEKLWYVADYNIRSRHDFYVPNISSSFAQNRLFLGELKELNELKPIFH